MRFSSLVDQEQVRRILIQTADRDQLPNSFLFCGPEGVGKWVAALALTAYLNCRDSSENDSCGRCAPCRQIDKLQYPNLNIAVPTPPSKSDKEENENYWEILNQKIAEPYALISGKRQMSIPVATVRDIRRNLAQKPSVDGHRVVVIEQMDRMLTSSADALLKLIEEPPPRTLMIITTSRPERIPQTVVSRCRRVRFARLATPAIATYLTDHAAVSENQARVLARLCSGSLGRALYLTDEDITQDREIAKLIFKGFFDADLAEVIAEASELLPTTDRFRINRILAVWQSLFRDLLLLQSGTDRTTLINVDFAVELERLAGRAMNPKALAGVPAVIGAVIDDIDINVETRTAVAALLIDLARRLGLQRETRTR